MKVSQSPPWYADGSLTQIRPKAGQSLWKRGFGLPGLIFLLMILAVMGIALFQLARQARRSSDWFFLAQIAYDLADSGAKRVMHSLQTHGGPGSIQGDPMQSGFQSLFQALSRAQPMSRSICFLSTNRPESLSPHVEAQLRLHASLDPRLEVSVQVAELEPLWAGSLAGLPSDPREVRGRIQLNAWASVTNSIGICVTRSISIERGFKKISILPPLLGRFSLFVEQQSPQDINFVKVKRDTETGDGHTAPGPIPLVVRSGLAGRAVEAGSNGLNRSELTSAFKDSMFLDRQGWVYLGNPGAKPWKLRLAHGFSGEGESHLLPGYYTRAMVNGSKSDEELFERRFQEAFSRASRCSATLGSPGDGLYHLHHGFAEEYELIGLSPGRQYLVQGMDGRRAKLEMGPGDASALRLFGTPAATSPTLVFGPVERVTMRKAVIQCTFGATDAMCMTPGRFIFPLLLLRDHIPTVREALLSTFGTPEQYEEYGPRISTTMFTQSLNVVLDSNGGGYYGTSGILHRSRRAVPKRAFTSVLLPWLGSIPNLDGLSQDAKRRLWSGDLDAPRLFRGTLDGGMRAFYEALCTKAVVRVNPEAVGRKIRVGSALKVPGVTVVDQQEPLVLGLIDRVEAGGILVNRGPIHITGNILRGAAKEPLTLVSGSGDIVISPGVEIVEAYLVALCGKVRFSPTPVSIVGGLAAHELDVEGLRSLPAARTIRYAEDMDPTGSALDSSYRVYYGGEERVSVSGEER